jgi:hypothetical protein
MIAEIRSWAIPGRLAGPVKMAPALIFPGFDYGAGLRPLLMRGGSGDRRPPHLRRTPTEDPRPSARAAALPPRSSPPFFAGEYSAAFFFVATGKMV